MKDPCIKCFIQSCCTLLCEPRIIYTIEIYNIYKNNSEEMSSLMSVIHDRNQKITTLTSSSDKECPVDYIGLTTKYLDEKCKKE